MESHHITSHRNHIASSEMIVCISKACGDLQKINEDNMSDENNEKVNAKEKGKGRSRKKNRSQLDHFTTIQQMNMIIASIR
jgi:hypothetical protein